MLEQIKNTIKLTTNIYLEKHIPRIPEDKKQIAISAYEKDIERIANYIYNSWFFNENFLLNEEFIKWLHKTFYPEWFTQKWIDENWKEITWMIPGEYKKIDNFVNTKEKEQFFQDLPWWSLEKAQYTKKELVIDEMQKIIIDFNNNFNKNISLEEKKDLVYLFVLDFISIHPFSDWNGRIAWIVLDLYLEKLWFSGIWLKTLAWKNKLEWDRIIFLAQNERNPKYIYDFIEKQNGMI